MTRVATWELRAAFARRLATMYGGEVPAYDTLVEVTREDPAVSLRSAGTALGVEITVDVKEPA